MDMLSSVVHLKHLLTSIFKNHVSWPNTNPFVRLMKIFHQAMSQLSRHNILPDDVRKRYLIVEDFMGCFDKKLI